MKKKFNIFALFILFCFLQFASAQNLGFLGKRVLFNFDIRLSPTLNYPNYYGNEYFLSQDLTIAPGIEFIVHNTGTIGFNYSLMNSQFTTGYYSSYYPFSLTGYSFFYKQYIIEKGDYYQAPFGVYSMLRFDYMIFKAPEFMGITDNKIMGLKVEFGIDYLIWNRLRLSWGVSIGLTNKMYNPDDQNYFDPLSEMEQIHNRIFVNYVFNHKFSIGFLVF